MINRFNAIQIQTIQGCNLLCSFCPNSYLPQTMKLMDENLYFKIIDQLKEIDYGGRVSPYLMNEPLLDKRLVKLVKYTREQLPKAELTVTTNGLLATKDNLKDLLNAGIDKILVSCYTKKIHDKIREFNISKDKVSLTLFYKQDSITQGFYNRGGNIKIDRKPTKYCCPRPFIQMYIVNTGEAVLCCSDYKREVILGDLNSENIIDIWQNKKYQKYRDKLKNNKKHELLLCKDCNY